MNHYTALICPMPGLRIILCTAFFVAILDLLLTFDQVAIFASALFFHFSVPFLLLLDALPLCRRSRQDHGRVKHRNNDENSGQCVAVLSDHDADIGLRYDTSQRSSTSINDDLGIQTSDTRESVHKLDRHNVLSYG